MKKQSRRQLLKLLTDWKSAFLQIEQTVTKLEAIFGVKPEAEIYTAFYAMFQDYTKALAVVVGDTTDLLHWYCWDNEMGKNKFVAMAHSWEERRPIASLNDLLSLIQDSK